MSTPSAPPGAGAADIPGGARCPRPPAFSGAVRGCCGQCRGDPENPRTAEHRAWRRG